LNYERFGRRWQRVLAVLALGAIPALLVEALVRAQSVDRRWIELTVAVETDEWEHRYRNQIVQLWGKAQRIKQTEIRPLRSLPVEPDTEILTKVISAFDHARNDLDQAAELLRKAGPFRAPAMEQERRGMLTQVEDEMQSLEGLETRKFFVPWIANFQRDSS